MKRIVALLVISLLLCGCGGTKELNKDIDNPITPAPTLNDIHVPYPTGVDVFSDDLVELDYSNISQGYIMVKTLSEDHNCLKVRVIKDDETYDYDINKELDYVAYPLNMGDGHYQIKVCENIQDNRYALLFDVEFDVVLDDEKLPYLYPNIVIDYSLDDEVVDVSFKLVDGDETTLQRVEHLYRYVVDNIRYDKNKLEELELGFVSSDLNYVIKTKSGICLDYASLLCALLRIQSIPCKVLTGFVDDGYHAWVEVYIDENVGWISPEIYFEKEWNTADPTFDATSKKYDGNYEIKYEY